MQKLQPELRLTSQLYTLLNNNKKDRILDSHHFHAMNSIKQKLPKFKSKDYRIGVYESKYLLLSHNSHPFHKLRVNEALNSIF